MEGVFVPWTDRSGRHGWAGYMIDGSGCHVWLGGVGSDGYGRVYRDGRTHPAHRLRYEMEVGAVPPGMQLDHYVCNNPSCCNPYHLRPVTPRENTLRGNGTASANAAKTHCLRGHALTPDNLSKAPTARRKRLCLECQRGKRRRHAERLRGQAEPVALRVERGAA